MVFKATIDTVDHSILLNQLAHCFGLRGSALAWFRSYLSDRSHFVCIRGVRSATHSLSCASGICAGTDTVLTLCLATRGYCEAMQHGFSFLC